jgi:hypothetical protein
VKNKAEDLRDHLFETLESLRDKDEPMDLDRAKTVAAVAQVIIQSAKVEVDLLRVTGGQPDSAFFSARALPAPGQKQIGKSP